MLVQPHRCKGGDWPGVTWQERGLGTRRLQRAHRGRGALGSFVLVLLMVLFPWMRVAFAFQDLGLGCSSSLA